MPNTVEITYGREVVLNDAGIVDERAIKAFTCGQCHALALAVHRISGLPIVGIWRPIDSDYDVPAHVAVQLPNGDLLDIQGPRVEERWVIRKVETLKARKIHGLSYYVKPNLKAAKPFAKTLIQKYSKEINVQSPSNEQESPKRSQEVVPTQTTFYAAFQQF